MRIFWLLLGVTVILNGCESQRDTGYRIEDGVPVLVSWNEAIGRHSTPVKGADASTFKVLLPGNYARDRLHVYYHTDQIENADPGSFTPLKDEFRRFAKDKNHVYMQQLVILDADPKTFELLTFPFSRDRQHIFCGTELVPTENADKFQVVFGSGMLHMSGPIDPADDADTKQRKRQIVGIGWAIDGTFVFCGAHKLEGADCESFRPQDEWRANDKNRHYNAVDVLVPGPRE